MHRDFGNPTAASIERLMADCRVRSMTISIDVDPASLPADTDPITLKVTVAPHQLRLGMRYDYLPEVRGPHADGPIEICPRHEMVMAMEARPDPVTKLTDPAPVQVTWHPTPATAVDVPALVKDHVRLGAELRELTAVHETLLEAILQNADEDIHGGDEAAEYLAEAYVRHLEAEVARLRSEASPEVPWNRLSEMQGLRRDEAEDSSAT
jgi:hypothetical protein